MAAPIEPVSATLVPRDLLDIFVKPSRFFGTRLAAGSTPYILLVAWCFGIADAMDRIDRQILQAAMGTNPAGWETVGPLVTQSWIGYWAFCLAVGAVSAGFLWMVGGWWFRVRAKWAGDPDPDKHMARLVYVYSSFVMAAPVILVALGQTMAFPDYAAAWQSDEVYSLGLLIFPFWSIAASYIGVRSVFNVSAWKARIWFLILPACVYLAAFGVIAMAAAFLMA
jgi:hypothetical protein